MPERSLSQLDVPITVLATAGAMGMVQSGFLHRGKTHEAVKFHPYIEQAGKFATWMLSGMNQKEWEVVHRTHHAFTDREPTAEEWEELQLAYPGAPIEAFRDPHSPIIEGHLNVLFKNAGMYRRSAKAIMAYLHDLEARNVPREEWPPHLQRVDLTEDAMDKRVYNRKMSGVLGLTALGGALIATKGPKKAVGIMALHIPLVLGVGGVVNSFGHLGAAKGFKERSKVMFGMEDAVPDEVGSYASDFFTGYEGVTAGEARHGYHHKNLGDAFISSDANPLRDPTGVVINAMTHLTVGGKPLAELPSAT